jgi:acetyl-CoA carboxylase biotin carboxyl carrier protein
MADKVGKLETALIRELAAILRESDLGEVEIQQGDLRIRVSKGQPPAIYAAAVGSPGNASAPGPQQSSTTPAALSAAGLPPPHPVTRPAAVEDHPGKVTSPMVGTCYLSAEQGAPPLVKIGDMVSLGQTLLLVEAMKTFNPVTAHKAGRIAQILVANEQPVEFGEPLVIIE